MPREPLPLKCILEILRILSTSTFGMDTMTRLLRVNKTVCAATLPFLYNDFFNICMLNIGFDRQPSAVIHTLIRTLLRQVRPLSLIPDLLRVAYLSQDDQDNTTEPPTPMFKYGSFIRKIVFYREFLHPALKVIHDPPLVDYADTHHLYERYVDEGLIPNHIKDTCRDEVLEGALQIDISRQMTWTFCQDHLENVEELSIPLTDIERYIDHVDQFTSLSKVQFWGANVGFAEFIFNTQEDSEQHDKELRQLADRYSRAMVQFFQRHTSIHKNVLRHVEVPHLSGNQLATLDLEFEMQSLLPPLHNPQWIAGDNLCQIVARYPDTNLSHVENISLRTGHLSCHAEKMSKLVSSQPPFLPLCRALKHLDIETFGPDMFHWAVVEKRQKDEAAACGRESTVNQYEGSGQHGHHNSLIPLQSICISGTLTLAQELNDIAFAFSDSLERFTVDEGDVLQISNSTDLATTPKIVRGQGWSLPRLQALYFTVNSFQLSFDMDALQRCGALESLYLQDPIKTYNHQDIQTWSSVNLPHLKELYLKGSPALHFNLDSLYHSPCLEVLTMEMGYFERPGSVYYQIPSPKELELEGPATQSSIHTTTDDDESSGAPGTSQRYPSIEGRPRLSWDWYLPKLCRLELYAVFAFRFDFKWLLQLPNLQHIHLDARSSEDRAHERHITLKDLLRGQWQVDNDGSKEILSDRYISVPKLESFELNGQWIFDEKVLEVICLAVAPNLRTVNLERGCTGYSLQEWLALSRRMPHIEKMCLELPHTLDEVQELGLVSMFELFERQDELHDKKRIEYILPPESFYDIVE